MHYFIKSLFYAIALLTLYWLTKQPAEEVTMVAWVHLIQSASTQQLAAFLTAGIYLFDQFVGGLLTIKLTSTTFYTTDIAPGRPKSFDSESKTSVKSTGA